MLEAEPLQAGTPKGGTHWRSTGQGTLPKRSVSEAILRGFIGRCPNCGKGRLFRAFLKVNDFCPVCGEALHHHRADDAPPYITMLIVGHIVVPIVLIVVSNARLSVLTHLSIWLPLTLALTLGLLGPVKGAVVGLQWALRMHGFHPDGDAVDPVAEYWSGPGGGDR